MNGLGVLVARRVSQGLLVVGLAIGIGLHAYAYHLRALNALGLPAQPRAMVTPGAEAKPDAAPDTERADAETLRLTA